MTRRLTTDAIRKGGWLGRQWGYFAVQVDGWMDGRTDARVCGWASARMHTHQPTYIAPTGVCRADCLVDRWPDAPELHIRPPTHHMYDSPSNPLNVSDRSDPCHPAWPGCASHRGRIAPHIHTHICMPTPSAACISSIGEGADLTQINSSLSHPSQPLLTRPARCTHHHLSST